MSDVMAAMCADLEFEVSSLMQILEPLTEEAWATPTPAEGWDIKDQISHLAFYDQKAVLSHEDPGAFAEHVAAVVESGGVTALQEQAPEMGRTMTASDVLAWWQRANSRFREVYAPLDPATRVLWYGPPMGARSKVTARIMETWAHGVDIRDALGIDALPDRNLRHVCHLSVRTRRNAYHVNGLEPPPTEPYVVLRHGDETWTWGEPDSPQRVEGGALGFALVSTQRRHRLDTDLVTVGAEADEWIDIAQAFAGPPGSGREPARN